MLGFCRGEIQDGGVDHNNYGSITSMPLNNLTTKHSPTWDSPLSFCGRDSIAHSSRYPLCSRPRAFAGPTYNLSWQCRGKTCRFEALKPRREDMSATCHMTCRDINKISSDFYAIYVASHVTTRYVSTCRAKTTQSRHFIERHMSCDMLAIRPQ